MLLFMDKSNSEKTYDILFGNITSTCIHTNIYFILKQRFSFKKL